MISQKREFNQGFVEGYNDSMYGASNQFPQGARHTKLDDIPFVSGYYMGYCQADYELYEQTIAI